MSSAKRPRGHVKEIRPGVWRLVLPAPNAPDGSRRQFWATYHGDAEGAERERTRLLAELDAGRISPEQMTARQFLLDRWLEGHQAGRVQPGTYTSYARACRLAAESFGSVRLQKLRVHHLQAHLDRLRKDGYAPGTILGHRRVLCLAFRAAVRWELLSRSPAEGSSAPSQRRAKRRVLSLDETRRLLRALEGTPTHVPALLAIAAGLRLGECLALRWADVSLTQDAAGNWRAAVTVRRSIDPRGRESETKTGDESTLPLPAFAAAALARHRDRQRERAEQLGDLWEERGLVVDGGRGLHLPRSTLQRQFRRALETAGIPRIRFHDLRHGHGSHLLQHKVPLRDVSERLRHANPATTMRVYSHLLPDHQDQAAALLDELLGDDGGEPNEDPGSSNGAANGA